MASTKHNVIIRFATPQGTQSSTVWRDCLPPRSGDMVKVQHMGREWTARCGAAVVDWEQSDAGPVQVFAVAYKPVSTTTDMITEGC